MKNKILIIILSACLYGLTPCAAQDNANVNSLPTFRGGDIETFNEWVFRKVVYLLDNSLDFKEGGVVSVSFTIDKKGKIKNVALESGYDDYLSGVVVSAIRKAPAWTPANENPTEVKAIADIQLYKHRIYLPAKLLDELSTMSNTPTNIPPNTPPKELKLRDDQKFPAFKKQSKDNRKADEAFLREWVGAQILSRHANNTSNLSGRVVLDFIINKSGYVEDVIVMKTTNPRLSRVAIDIMYSCPQWYSPGISEGKPVRVKFTLPIIVGAPVYD